MKEGTIVRVLRDLGIPEHVGAIAVVCKPNDAWDNWALVKRLDKPSWAYRAIFRSYPQHYLERVDPGIAALYGVDQS